MIAEPVAAARLGRALRERGYTGEAVAGALALRSAAELRYADFPVYDRQLGADPLATLTRLFLLNRPVSVDEAEAALAPVRLSELADCRLVTAEPNGVVASTMITPFAGLLVASDPRPEIRSDHVQGVSRASETAAALAVTQPVDATLDIGTGSGVLALLAARHSTRVVGTDVNPRALAYARLSAILSGVESAEWRAGSLYEPVAGERFGFISSNAPFVISPDTRFVFRDSAQPGHEFCAELVRQTPEGLVDGGFAELNVSWALEAGQDWTEPVRGWLTASGCDAWLLRSYVTDPLTHAAAWNRPLDAADPAEFGKTLDRWVAYFDREGITEIAVGTLYLRRRPSARNWFRADELPRGPFGAAGEHVLRVFANQDVLEELGDDAIRRLPLSFDVPHSLRRVERAGDGWATERARLYLREGLRFRLDLDERTLALLPRLDGSELGDAADDVVRELRRLVELGFLTFGAPRTEDSAQRGRQGSTSDRRS